MTTDKLAYLYKLILFRHDVLPIVMGARPEDYARDAPAHSYIHVDEFKGPKELAEYLHQLDKDDEKYNEYFQVILVLILRQYHPDLENRISDSQK